MFKNLKIGVRLGIGFATVLILLSTIGVMSYQRINALNDEITNMVNDKYPKTVVANDIIDNINGIARFMRNTLLMKEPKAS